MVDFSWVSKNLNSTISNEYFGLNPTEKMLGNRNESIMTLSLDTFQSL